MASTSIDKASQLRGKLAANEAQATTLRSACAELEDRLRLLLGEEPRAAQARDPHLATEPDAHTKAVAEDDSGGKDGIQHDQQRAAVQGSVSNEEEDRKRSRKEMVERARAIQKAHIDRLHAYNEVRDLGNALLAKIAAATGETQRAVMDRYGVEADD